MWVDDAGPWIIILGFVGPMVIAYWMATTSESKEEVRAWIFSVFVLMIAFFLLYTKVLFA